MLAHSTCLRAPNLPTDSQPAYGLPTCLRTPNLPTDSQPAYGLPTCLRAPNLPTGSQPAYGLPTCLRAPNLPTDSQHAYGLPTCLRAPNMPTGSQPAYGLPTCLRAPNLPTGSQPAYGLPTCLRAPVRLQCGGSPAPAPPRLPHLTSKPRAPACTFSQAACAWFGNPTPSNVQREAGAPLPPHPRAPVGAATLLASLGRRAAALCNDQRDSVVSSLPLHRPSLFGQAFPRCRAFYYYMRLGTSVAHRPSNVQRPPRGQAGGHLPPACVGYAPAASRKRAAPPRLFGIHRPF